MINLLFCGNDGVFDGVLTATLSIVKRSRNDEPITLYLMTMDLQALKPSYRPMTQRHAEVLRKVLLDFHPQSRVELLNVTELYQKEFAGCPNESAYCSPYTLIRLLADLCPTLPSKLLYLDADVMFNRDVHLLYEQDVSCAEYAAARDHYGKYLINPNYINAGVLLFNLEMMKKTGILSRARALLRKKKLTFADQSALIRCTTRCKLLPQKYNDQKFLHASTVVRHFSKRLFWLPYPHTENVKQWQIERVRAVFGYRCFDDVYESYQTIKHTMGDDESCLFR